MDFIDLQGASGATYRFRIWPETGHHQPMAGNYAIVAEGQGRLEVRLLGVALDLSQIRLKAEPAGRLYTRLNVARATRTSEHEDLAAAHPDAQVEQHGA